VKVCLDEDLSPEIPDDFRLVARRIAHYVKRAADSPSEYLFDFV